MNVGNLTYVPTISVVLGLFIGFPIFTRFIGIFDGIPYAPFLTLGLLVFIGFSGEELLGLTSSDLPRIS